MNILVLSKYELTTIVCALLEPHENLEISQACQLLAAKLQPHLSSAVPSVPCVLPSVWASDSAGTNLPRLYSALGEINDQDMSFAGESPGPRSPAEGPEELEHQEPRSGSQELWDWLNDGVRGFGRGGGGGGGGDRKSVV